MDMISRMLIRTNEMLTTDIFYPVAQTMLQNIRQVPMMTIAEAAELCAVSQPTISRFARTMGCRSFPHLKVEIAMALTADEEPWDISPSPLRQPFHADTYAAVIQEALRQLSDCLTPASCTRLTDDLRKAHVVLFNFSGIDPVLKFQRVLCLDGKLPIQLKSPAARDLAQIEPLIQPGDFLFVKTSEPWEMSNKLPVARRLKDLGLNVAFLATDLEAAAAMEPDYLFPLSTKLEVASHIQIALIFWELFKYYTG